MAKYIILFISRYVFNLNTVWSENDGVATDQPETHCGSAAGLWQNSLPSVASFQGSLAALHIFLARHYFHSSMTA